MQKTALGHIPSRVGLMATWLLATFASLAFAQAPKTLNWTNKEGLTDNFVSGIVTDKQGYIWVGTSNGASRFDSHRFEGFNTSDGLPDNELTGVFKDSRDRIWFMTFNGKPGYYDGRFHNPETDQSLASLAYGATLEDITESKNGDLWFCFRGPVLKRLDAIGNVKVFEPNEEGGFEFNVAGNILSIDTNGHVCIFNELYEVQNKLLRLNSDGKLVVETFDSKAFSIAALNKVVARGLYNLRIINDERYPSELKLFAQLPSFQFSYAGPGIFWVYNPSGVLHFFVEGDGWKEAARLPVRNLSVCIYDWEDQPAFWIGTQGGGLSFCPNFLHKTYFSQLGEPHVTALLGLADKGLIAGFADGALRLIGHPQVQEINIRPENYPKTDRVHGIIPDGIGRSIVVAHDGGISEVAMPTLSKRLLSPLGAVSLCRMNGFLFAGSREHTIMIGDGGLKSVFPNRTNALFATRDNRLVIGGNSGVSLYENDRVVDWPEARMVHGSVTAISQLQDGRLVIATNVNGLFVWSSNGFAHFHIGNGLYSGTIRCLFPSGGDSLWMGTDRGLMLATFSNGEIKSRLFTTSDGLAGNDVYTCLVENGQVYVGTSEGLSVFNPGDMGREDKPPGVFFRKITVNGTVQPGNEASLAHFENSIQFDFTGISYRSMGEMQFRYRLFPTDQVWTYSNLRSVSYMSLPPGEYRFEVFAINKEKMPSTGPAYFVFNIMPRTIDALWFRVTAGVCILLVISGGVLLRIRMIKRETDIKNKLLVLEQRALLTQMNPHFIYNSLSSIQQFIAKNDKRQASIYLAKFSSLIRNILQHSKSPLISIDNEVETLGIYLELEKMRFSDQFVYSVSIDEELLESGLMIPAMMVQPFVENAIIHGLNPLWLEGRAGKLEILFEEGKDGYLHCRIEDNGVGRKRAEEIKRERVHQHTSTAIQNITERLQLLTTSVGKHGKVLYTDLFEKDGSPGGTRVDIYIPVS